MNRCIVIKLLSSYWEVVLDQSLEEVCLVSLQFSLVQVQEISGLSEKETVLSRNC